MENMRPFFVAINGQKIKTKRQRGIVGTGKRKKVGGLRKRE